MFMAKTNELNSKQRIILCLLFAVVIASMVSALKIVNLLPTLVFIIFLLIILLFAGSYVISIVVEDRKKKKAEQAKLKAEKEALERKKKELYDILGIEIQYNTDGTVKDLYELLGIEKCYDEDGKRQLTSYEIMGIIPKFYPNLNERPSVFVIKNRINKVAKGIVDAPKFVRKVETNSKLDKPAASKTEAKSNNSVPKKKGNAPQGFIKQGGKAKPAKMGEVGKVTALKEIKPAPAKSNVDLKAIEALVNSSKQPKMPQSSSSTVAKSASAKKQPAAKSGIENKDQQAKMPKVDDVNAKPIHTINLPPKYAKKENGDEKKSKQQNQAQMVIRSRRETIVVNRQVTAHHGEVQIGSSSVDTVFMLKNPVADFNSVPWFMDNEGEMGK